MRIKNLIGLISIVACLNIPVLAHSADPRLAYKPDWSIGMKWKVEVTRMSEAPSKPAEEIKNFKPRAYTVTYEFTIEALDDIDSERCFRVRIDNAQAQGKASEANAEYWRIYVRQIDFTLKKVERLNTKSERVEASHKFKNKPTAATDWVGTLPMDFPSFNAQQLDFVPKSLRMKDGTEIYADHIHQ